MTANCTEGEMMRLAAAQQRVLLMADSARTRIFFPCYLEDAMILLAGLCISVGFPDEGVELAIISGEV